MDQESEVLPSAAVVGLARTVTGKGVPFMENNAAWHGTPPNLEQLDRALEELL